MCIFVTAIVPADLPLKQLKPLLDEYGMLFSELNNQSVKALFPGQLYVKATRSTCDCDTALGAYGYFKKQEEEERQQEAKEIAKLKKKGWSQGKTERWLAEKSTNRQRHSNATSVKLDDELTRWCEFIAKLFAGSNMSSLGLLVHMYHGGLEDEITIKGQHQLDLSPALKEKLLGMEHDCFYWISK